LAASRCIVLAAPLDGDSAAGVSDKYAAAAYL